MAVKAQVRWKINRIRRNIGQFKQSRQQVFVLIVAFDALAGRQLGRIADDERDIQHIVIDAVMVEPAFMVIKRFAMVAVDDDNGIVHDAVRFQRLKDRLYRRVHIGDGAVVLGDNIILVSDARRHP